MTAPAFHIIIPARMASQRLPGKPLLEIAGRPLVEHVYGQAVQSSACAVVIATDDERILRAAQSFGAQVLMTSAGHASGSDRIAECVDILGLADDALVVNLQADEPLMPPACLDQVANLLATDPQADVASLYWPLHDAAEVLDRHTVKVVTAVDGSAIYFSRSVIPYGRDAEGVAAALHNGIPYKRHIGLYAYRARVLRRMARWPPGVLERAEKLEQLRLLENGGRILMAQSCCLVHGGVDTPEDLERVRQEIG